MLWHKLGIYVLYKLTLWNLTMWGCLNRLRNTAAAAAAAMQCSETGMGLAVHAERGPGVDCYTAEGGTLY
jgi:hypothetical protein